MFIHLAVLCGKNFNVGHYMQTFLPVFVIPAMHKGTVDFNQFIPLSLTLAGWGSQGQCKSKHLCFIFSHTLQQIGIKCDVVLKQFKLNIVVLFLSEI